jgi:hypothetical protein
MKRKMTFFALAGKCGALGICGLSIRDAAFAAFPLSKEVSATEPRLSPQSFMNQRREKERWVAWSMVGGIMVLVLGDGFVEIQQHTRHGGGGRKLGKRVLAEIEDDGLIGF